MIKDLRYLFVALFAFVSSMSFADAYKVLTFPDGNSEKISAYTKTWTATLDGFTWTIENFNNNNNGWAYIKCGRKGNESVASISTETAVDEALGTVVVTIDAITADNVNGISLTVASDKDFNNVVETVNAETLAKGDMTFNVTKSAANNYYKLTFDCKSGTANGIIQVSKVSYYKTGDAPVVVDITNTPETAYTVAKAHELIAAGEGLAAEVYVKGYVSKIDELSTQYGNATYYISDTKAGDNELYVFRGYYLGGEKFTSEDQLNVGDEVIVYGQLTVYNGNGQIGTGSKLYSVEGKTTAIGNVSAAAAGKAEIYNLAGQRTGKAAKGVNIIGGKKYMVK